MDPQSSSQVALVWRGGRDWNQPRALVVPDDPSSRMAGNVHFLNLTASPLAVVVGPAKIRLDPGKSFTRRVTAEGGAISLEILYPTVAGGLRSCHSSSLEATGGNYSRFVIFPADGKKPRLPVKVLHLQEPG